MLPSGSRASLHEVRQCLARLSRLAAPHRHQPLEAALDALTKPITSSFSNEADVCMVDAEPVATPADALDDSSDALDGGAAGDLISAVDRFRAAIAGGETDGGGELLGECRALVLTAADDARHAASAAERRRAAATSAVSKRIAAETVSAAPPAFARTPSCIR